MTFYLIGSLITITMIYFVFKRNKKAYLAKYRKSALIASATLLTLSSWIFIGLVIYKHFTKQKGE